MNDRQETVRWEISVPIFRNPIIMKQLGLAIGIPFSVVGLAVALASGWSRDTLYALGFISGLLILTGLFVMLVYRGRYEAEFVLDGKGILCRTQENQARKNRIINALTVVFGLLTGRLAVAGAGQLAQSRQTVSLRWNRITKVQYRPESRTILLRGAWTEQIALFCTDNNYEQVEAYVQRNVTPPRAGEGRRE